MRSKTRTAAQTSQAGLGGRTGLISDSALRGPAPALADGRLSRAGATARVAAAAQAHAGPDRRGARGAAGGAAGAAAGGRARRGRARLRAAAAGALGAPAAAQRAACAPALLARAFGRRQSAGQPDAAVAAGRVACVRERQLAAGQDVPASHEACACMHNAGTPSPPTWLGAEARNACPLQAAPWRRALAQRSRGCCAARSTPRWARPRRARARRRACCPPPSSSWAARPMVRAARPHPVAGHPLHAQQWRASAAAGFGCCAASGVRAWCRVLARDCERGSHGLRQPGAASRPPVFLIIYRRVCPGRARAAFSGDEGARACTAVAGALQALRAGLAGGQALGREHGAGPGGGGEGGASAGAAWGSGRGAAGGTGDAIAGVGLLLASQAV